MTVELLIPFTTIVRSAWGDEDGPVIDGKGGPTVAMRQMETQDITWVRSARQIVSWL